jgi:hypothetical protein
MSVTEAFLARALELAGAREVRTHWLPVLPAGERDGVALVQVRREMTWS